MDLPSKAKICGYLEKKGRMKMMSSYKKYWFVLESRLLLYYRSKEEYDALYPFKGSMNLGPLCIVKPCSSLVGVFQIENRSNTITLRAESREEQNRWMHAIMSSLNQTTSSPTKLGQFTHRYSMDELPQVENSDLSRASSPIGNESKIIKKLQKLGAQTYDRSFVPITTFASKNSSKDLRNISTSIESVTSPYAVVDIKRKSGSVDRLPCILVENDTYDCGSRLVKNDLYSTTPYRHKNMSMSLERLPSMLIENTAYGTAQKYNERRKTDIFYDKASRESLLSNNSVIYSIPITKPTCTPDQNENIITNDIYSSGNVNNRPSLGPIYSEPKFERDQNENVMTEQNGYMTINDECVYMTIDERVRSRNSSVESSKDIIESGLSDNVFSSSNEEIQSNRKMSFKTLSNKLLGQSCDKDKEKEKKVKKSSSFLQRVWKKKEKPKQKKEEEVLTEEIYETVPAVSEKIVGSDESKIQMLSELRNIIERKMPLLEKSISESEDIPERREGRSLSMDSVRTKKDFLPVIPPKSQKQLVASPFHDVPKNNQPLNKIILPAKTKMYENVKTLDEILNELDKEKPLENGSNVKKLIKKFSNTSLVGGDEKVILRDKQKVMDAYRHSDELTRLLDELSKVTQAPILTPGATCSMISHSLTDEELVKLLPVRRRRLSDPDYDIPRSHKSLSNWSKKEPEDVIGATRFFGPVLPENINQQQNDDYVTSEMTPDSLEMGMDLSGQEERNVSYTSHNYACENEFIINNAIYAQPKKKSQMYITFNTEKIDDQNEKTQDIFVDSLEVCAEVSTVF